VSSTGWGREAAELFTHGEKSSKGEESWTGTAAGTWEYAVTKKKL